MRVSRSSFALALAASSTLVVAAGCGGRIRVDADGGVDASVDASVDSGCSAGLAACGTSCVDTATDAKHCGSCSHACAPSQTCQAGACGSSCGPTQTLCGSVCVSTATDPANCGGCNKVCPDGFGCVASQCAIACGGGQTKCGALCVDTQVDNANCGGCGSLCDVDGGGGCQKGLCCSGGTANCGGKCIGVLADPQNCGQCGIVCPVQAPTCAAGKCTSQPILGKLGPQTFYKIPVSGKMTDTNVYNACVAAGLTVGCSSVNCPTYTDNLCTPTQESSCGNPMLGLAGALGCGNPASCAPLNGVYQYMGQKWQNGSACGAENGSWCAQGDAFSDRWALCVQ